MTLLRRFLQANLWLVISLFLLLMGILLIAVNIGDELTVKNALVIILDLILSALFAFFAYLDREYFRNGGMLKEFK